MRPCIIIVLLLLGSFFVSTAQQTDTTFQKEWLAIDTLIIKNDLTRTALDKVNVLYQKAKQRKLPDQIIKTLIYRYTLEDFITDNDPNHTIKIIQSEINFSKNEIQKAIFYSLLAKEYQRYYNENRWSLYGRKKTASQNSDDIATWSNDDFLTAIRTYFLLSLKNKTLLQQTNVNMYDAIIVNGNSRKLRPTLFDLLAHEALTFLKSYEAIIPQANVIFTLSDTNALMPAAVFIKHKFTTKDSSSAQWRALILFQELIIFHSNDANKDALINVDIERIEWVNEQAAFKEKELLYKRTLEGLTEKYFSHPATGTVWRMLAEIESDKAAKYVAFTDTTNRFGYVNALKIINKALSLFPEKNTGTEEMKNLSFQIHKKELSTETELVNIPGKPILASVSYRNTDTLFTRIIRIESKDTILGYRSRSRYGYGDWDKLTRYPSFRSMTQPLPFTNDYQKHTAEFKIEGLPVGSYALLVSSGNDFNDSLDNLCIQFFEVSNISYLQSNNDLFVLNRENGSPITDVTVLFIKEHYDYKLSRTLYDTLDTQKTDKTGYCSPNVKDEYLRYIFILPGDTLRIGEGAYISRSTNEIAETVEEFERKNSKVFFFTDRSIYRPGQSVYFKGIAVTKDKTTQLNKIIYSQKTDWVYLKDVNRKTIDSLKYSLNSYGSFNGKFQIPLNGLTGVFHIETKNLNQSSVYFSVEEYKRPTFNVSFAKPKGGYKLNDTILITGTAKAYSGNAIDNAKVTYNITRDTRYFDPWFWRRTGGRNEREIANGEIKTGIDGKFTIKFVAQADDILDSVGNPLFDFSVKADITDNNGETRSASTKVVAGFNAMLLQINTSAVTEADSEHKISITTTNLSDEKEPASVQVNIYLLETPNRIFRSRFLSKPDQFIMSKEEFTRNFPNDEYDHESDFTTWGYSGSVFDQTIDTKFTDNILIPAGSLKAGNYRIEAITKDKYGKQVKAISYMRLFNRKETEFLPFVQDINYTIKDNVEPTQTASFLTGTFANHIFIMSKTQRPNDKKEKYNFEYRNAGIKTISFTPEERDRGNVTISEAFVYNNRVYTNQYRIIVPWTNKMLDITYTSYRDKTEPGSTEKWSVTIQGPKGEKTAAELLTSMYDASLDQFKPHSWSIPSIWPTNNQNSIFEGTSNFSLTARGDQNDPDDSTVQVTSVTYDHLAASIQDIWTSDLLKMINKNLPLSLRKQKENNINQLTYILRAYQNRRSGVNSLLLEGRVAGVDVKRNLTASTIAIRGYSSNAANSTLLYVVDGRIVSGVNDLDPANILSMTILKDTEAKAIYGSNGANGVIIITTTNNLKLQEPIQVRKNFNETAFFFPQLYADSTGKYSFGFTMPEALTQWKWMSFAHTKDLAFGTNTTNIITQKKLMVQPNAPRFMREGDNMEFSSKIVNLSDKEITGQVSFELIDATTNTSVDGWFQNVFPSQYFTVEAGQSFGVKFPIQIPFSYNRPLTWRITARAGEYSDGEENTLPVLTNRMLVTESLPLFLPNDTTMHVVFDKLLHTTSESLTHEAITVEYTSNPVWYAVQALPYLMEYPYECAEQTFNRFYANTLASYIVNKHPKIKQVFEQWKADSSSLKSNLQKNAELKQVLLQETPWVFQAENEEQQKKNISLLFDLVKLSSQTDALIQKLTQLQLPNGSFSWFKGGNEDRYMTNYILTGIGKLKRLGALSPETASRIRIMLVNALKYMDGKIAEDYNWLVKSGIDLNLQHVSSVHIDYLYMRSFFKDIAQQSPKEYDYFFKQGKQFWVKQNSYYKAELGLIYYRNNEETFATKTILPALQENAIIDPKQGLYWKSTYTGFWYQSPIEHQSMMIAFMSELNQDQKNASLNRDINSMKTWLLVNKQTNNWRTTVATADACYALLLNGTDWLDAEKKVTIQLGKTVISSADEKKEAGSGYFKKRIDGKQVAPEMGNIIITTNSKISQSPNSKINSSPSWGNIYWQYFEDLDKITSAATPLSLNKKLFIEKNTDKGKVLEPVNEGTELKTGDKIVVRIELRSDRDMDYLHLKDMRAASMEPVNVLSGYKWQDGFGYYESTKDASTNFFIDHLRKGTYVFDYPLFITHTGVFSVGIATIQCMYAPEFTSHSEGIKIRIAR